MKTKTLTYAQESIQNLILNKKEKRIDFQDYNELYSDYTYLDATHW